MKRTLSWIAAASFLLAAGNLKAVEVEVPGLLTDHTVSSVGHNFYRAFSDKWCTMGKLDNNNDQSVRYLSNVFIPHKNGLR